MRTLSLLGSTLKGVLTGGESSPRGSNDDGASAPEDGILNLRDVLVRLYTESNPEKLSSVDKIVEDYCGSGRRSHLVGALRKKYGEQFETSIAASNADAQRALEAAALEAAAATASAAAEAAATAPSEAGETADPAAADSARPSSSFMGAMASDARGLMSSLKLFGDGVRNGGEALQDGMRRRTTSFLESEQLQAMKGNNTSRIDAVLRRVNIERWQEMEPGRKEIANRGAAYAQAQAQAMAVIAARNDAIFAGTSEIDAGTKRLLPTMRHRAAAWEGFAKQANTLPEINERTKEVTCELEDVATLLRGLAEAVNKIEEKRRDEEHAQWEADQWAAVEAYQRTKQDEIDASGGAPPLAEPSSPSPPGEI